MAATILIVDDEKNILLTLNQALQLAGYRTELAARAVSWRWRWSPRGRWTRW